MMDYLRVLNKIKGIYSFSSRFNIGVQDFQQLLLNLGVNNEKMTPIKRLIILYVSFFSVFGEAAEDVTAETPADTRHSITQHSTDTCKTFFL